MLPFSAVCFGQRDNGEADPLATSGSGWNSDIGILECEACAVL